MPTLLTKSWLHFLLVGALLYGVQQWWQVPAVSLIDYPSNEKMAELRGQWLRSTGRVPSEQQVQQMVENEINQEMLFQEALKRDWHLTDTVVRQRLLRNMRFLDPQTTDDDTRLIQAALALELHENDLVVRRRLIQRMEMLAYGPVRQSQPTPAVLQQRYRQQTESLQHPALVQLNHIFISRDRHRDAKAKALELLQQIGARAPAQSQQHSDPFLHGLDFNLLSERQLARYFGVQFASDVFMLVFAAEDKPAATVTKQWLGPLTSSYGEHLVWVESWRQARAKTLAEVEKQLVAEWRRDQERLALQAMVEQLRQGYQVVLPLMNDRARESLPDA